MQRLQCLVRLEGKEADLSVHVVVAEVSPDDRIAVLQTRLAEALDATEGVQGKPNMKLYGVQQQRLTYRQDPTTKREVLFLNGAETSRADTNSEAVLRGAELLVPWALVSWYFHDQQFAFPDAIDVVLVCEDGEEQPE